jgi:hypothetical protein
MQSTTEIKKTSEAVKTPRLAIATIAAIATVGALGVAPAVASPTSGAAGCPTWMCGTSGNHNEVIATAGR